MRYASDRWDVLYLKGERARALNVQEASIRSDEAPYVGADPRVEVGSFDSKSLRIGQSIAFL